jgi:hypothetical protein
VIAAGSNNAFAINGFGGLTTAEIVSFFMVFIIFNAYVVLMAAALASFYFSARPRYGRVRTAAIWHFVAALWVMLAFISTVWGAPAEKSFVDSTAKALSLSQPSNFGWVLFGYPMGRAGMLFVGMIFAGVAVLCMLIGFVQGAQQRRELREQAFAV